MIDKHTRIMTIVHCLNFHRSLRKVDFFYKCCHTTLGRWIKREHGDKPKIRKISSIERIDELVSEIITNNPFSRLIDIVRDLKKHGVNISKSSVHRILTKYKFSRKKSCPKILSETNFERRRF